MLVVLQLLTDQLDFSGGAKLERLRDIDKHIISLDNFSESWLIDSAKNLLKETEGKIVIIWRHEEAEFQSLQSLIISLPQLNNIRVIYLGKEHHLMDKIRRFKTIKFTQVNDFDQLFREVRSHFT